MKKNTMTKEEKEKLKGHRNRLRKRFLTQNSDDMDDSRMLELLLTYSIPQIDVYPIANALLAKFGDLDNILSASINDLCSIKGIGENTAILIKLQSAITRKCVLAKNRRKTYKNPEDIAKLFCRMFYGICGEKLAVASFTNSFELLSCEWLSGGYPGECSVDRREIMKILVRDNVGYVAFAHNHPNGNVKPSASDIEAMFRLKEMINSVSVKLIDMFIISENKYFRMSDVATLSDKLGEYSEEEFSYVFGSMLSPDSAEFTEIVLENEF